MLLLLSYSNLRVITLGMLINSLKMAITSLGSKGRIKLQTTYSKKMSYAFQYFKHLQHYLLQLRQTRKDFKSKQLTTIFKVFQKTSMRKEGIDLIKWMPERRITDWEMLTLLSQQMSKTWCNKTFRQRIP